MTDQERDAEILRQFKGGWNDTDLSIDWDVSTAVVERILRAELLAQDERIAELERDLKEANMIIAMDGGE